MAGATALLASPLLDLRSIAETLHALNPGCPIVPAAFGVHRPDLSELEPAQLARAASATPALAHAEAHRQEHAEDAHAERERDHGEVALGLSAWRTAELGGPCDPDELEGVLAAVARGEFGAVERVKGIARAGAGWVRFDVAGGRPSMTAFGPGEGEAARVVAIGRAGDEPGLQPAFAACAAPAIA
jgi:G3E family GTPase